METVRDAVLRVKELREQRSMSRVALAEAVEVSPQTIWNIEEKDSEPKIILALKLARALGVPVEGLVKEDS